MHFSSPQPIAALAAQRIPSHLMDARLGRGLHSWSFATTTMTSFKFQPAVRFFHGHARHLAASIREIQV
jgi:hypothetical protein